MCWQEEGYCWDFENDEYVGLDERAEACISLAYDYASDACDFDFEDDLD